MELGRLEAEDRVSRHMSDVTAIDPAAQARSRRLLVLLACLFFGPMLVASLLYRFGAGPQGRVNHGELVSPAQPMPAGVLVPGKWALVVVAEQCDTACGDVLYRTRQVRTLLKGDGERVTRILLTRDATAALPESARDSAKGLTIVSLTTPAAAELLTALTRAAGASDAAASADGTGTTSGTAPHLYLTDPHANLVLHYPATFENPGLLKDLKKLLGLSSIG